MHTKTLKISIFMSVFNVHLNRAPVSARVVERSYHPGKFLVASVEKSSLLNEQNALVLETEDRFRMVLVQIAGFVARRIVCYAKAGDTLRSGDIFGLIRFGSRVDLYLPPDVKPLVRVGQHVKGGESTHRVSGMKKRRAPIRMKKGIYILPNLFTSGNLFCGFWSIISVFQEKYFFAAVAILLACLFDMLDGKVARLSGATSKFGVQYDSLADLISFGVAPALLAFSWALQSLWTVRMAGRLPLRGLRGPSAGPLQRHGCGRRYQVFQGAPHSRRGVMIALTILLYLRLIETGWVKDIVILVMIYVLAFLMVSNIRYYSFKEFNLAKEKPFSFFIFVVLTLIVIVMEPVVVLFGFILCYVFSGPVKMVMMWHKRRAMRGQPVEDEATVRG